MDGAQRSANAYHFSTGATLISFSAAISACDKARQWEQTLTLFHKVRATGVAANVICFNAAISACEKGEQWEQALTLLHKMRHWYD